jgi:hypothetical protein
MIYFLALKEKPMNCPGIASRVAIAVGILLLIFIVVNQVNTQDESYAN